MDDAVTGDWDEQVDEETLKVIWVHRETGEIVDKKPEDLELGVKESGAEKAFLEAQERLKKMKKGGRKELGKKKR